MDLKKNAIFKLTAPSKQPQCSNQKKPKEVSGVVWCLPVRCSDPAAPGPAAVPQTPRRRCYWWYGSRKPGRCSPTLVRKSPGNITRKEKEGRQWDAVRRKRPPYKQKTQYRLRNSLSILQGPMSWVHGCAGLLQPPQTKHPWANPGLIHSPPVMLVMFWC